VTHFHFVDSKQIVVQVATEIVVGFDRMEEVRMVLMDLTFGSDLVMVVAIAEVVKLQKEEWK
jgi:hypothetical protein